MVVLCLKRYMHDIKDLKLTELNEIRDFLEHIEEYGHVFYDDPATLDGPFKLILDGIEQIKSIINDNYSR